MLNISNLSIHYGNRYLFDSVSIAVRPLDRIGLVGRNGTGKSTLLKIITGEELPEEGTISMPNDYTLGYLAQEMETGSELSIYEETATALVVLQELERRIEAIGIELGERTDYESDEYTALVNELTDSDQHFGNLGGHTMEADIEQVLTGLGFLRTDFTRSVNEFSGGWQMRIELAKILLSKPSCILLDEPTNHLDIESIQWLEQFLRNYKGSIIMVSHDRKFLDTVTNRTIEISLGQIYDYNLNYSKFIVQRAEIRKQQQASFVAQQKEIQKTEKYIERFRSKASLATRVQSKVKQLAKVKRVEIDEVDKSRMFFKFPDAPRSGRLIAEAENLSKSYDDNLVLDKINFAIERGEKIAFVGKNGEGKSTLTRILAGIESHEGSKNMGYNVEIGYYAQHQAELLDPNMTVFDVIDKAATGDMRTNVRGLLGAFMFGGDAIDKKVKILSGGEKARLAICKMLLKPINFLILDEPTNHFDIAAKDVLKKALLRFDGAMIVVSHDRSFLHGLTDKTVYFKDHTLKEYDGDIYDFIDKQKIETLQELEAEKKASRKDKGIVPGKDKLARAEQKKFNTDANRLKKKAKTFEEQIETMEARISELEAMFEKPDFFKQTGATKKQYEFDQLKKEIHVVMDQWTEAQSVYDEFVK